MSQKDNFHIDFASKVQESRDGKQVVSKRSSSTRSSGNSKVADVEKDDPLTKTFRRRDLKREIARARVRIPSPNERNAPVVGPDGRRRPKRVPPPSKPPPPQESPLSGAEYNNDFGSKVSTNNEDRSSRKSGGSVRPPPRNPYRPPRGKPPPPSSPVRQSDKSQSDKYSTNNHSRRAREPRRRPPPRDKGIPYPRGMIPNNPRSIDNSRGASTSQLIAFATRHQAQIQKQQTHYIRKPPPGPPRPGGGSTRDQSFKPPLPKGSPHLTHKQSHRNSTGKVRPPPRSGNNLGGKKPPPPSGPPPQSAIDAGIRARSRQNSSNMFGLGQTVAYISDDGDDFESDDEDYKKKLTKRQQGQMQIRRRPTGTKKVKTAKNIRKEGHKGTQLRNEDRSINNKGTSEVDSRNNSQSGSKTIDISDDSDTEGEDEDGDKFYDVDADRNSSNSGNASAQVSKKKGRPKLSIQVDNSNKATPRYPRSTSIDEGKSGEIEARNENEEGKSPEKAVKKKKKRPNLTVMVTDSNHEAEDTTSGANDTSGNPFSGVGNLQINVDDGTQNFNETYHLSNSGAFNAEGFVIRETGIAKAPKDGQDSSRSSWGDAGYDDSGYGKNIRAEMLKLCVLGRGAGGIVYKSLHMPTMRIVAVKNIPVYESDKRHQMVSSMLS